MLSPSRFLYHTVGPVYLIRWSQEAGHSVLQLGSSEIQEHLTLDVEALRAQPLRLAQVRMAMVESRERGFILVVTVVPACICLSERAFPFYCVCYGE